MDRIRLKSDARNDLNGRFTEAVLPFLILLALEWGIGIFSTIAEYANNVTAAAIFSAFAAIVGIVWFFLVFPITVGISRYYISFVHADTPPTASIFDDLKKPSAFWSEFCAYILSYLCIFLGLVCLIVPGIYLALRFSQVKFVFAQHPDYSAIQAMKRSAEIMQGHYIEFMCLVLSFILWYLFAAITLGIGMLYVYPYTYCAYARYYLSLDTVYDKQCEEKIGEDSTQIDYDESI